MTLKAAAHACKRAARSAAVVTLTSRPRLEAPADGSSRRSSGSGSLTCFTSPWQTLRDQSVIQVEDNRATVSFWRVIRTAVLINLLDPKLTSR
jgi:threonine/homoserine/homoserine lactone efflux protein